MKKNYSIVVFIALGICCNSCNDNNQEKWFHEESKKGSWPLKEKEAFINSCIKNAENAGASSSYAEDYCDCSLIKVMDAYPDVNYVNKASIEELNNLVEDCK